MFKILFRNRNTQYILPLVVPVILNNKLNNQIRALDYPDTKDRIKGEYENKIRRYSPIEKVFELFASVKQDNELMMNHFDLFKALCPYNYQMKPYDQKEAEDFKSKVIMKIADINGDGLICLYEYFVLQQFIQTQEQAIKQYFQINGKNESLTKDQFKKFLLHLQDLSKSRITSSGMLAGICYPRKVKIDLKKLEQTYDQTIDNLFKDQQTIKLSQIISLKQELGQEILQYEYNQYLKDENNLITEQMFAKSLISYLDVKDLGKYLKHLEKFDLDGKINFEQYQGFHTFIQQYINEIAEKIEQKGSIGSVKLQKLIENYCKSSGKSYSESQIKIFINILDLNQNGRIDAEEFKGIVKSRSFYGNKNEVDPLQKPFISLVEGFQRFVDKSSRIWEIINE